VNRSVVSKMDPTTAPSTQDFKKGKHRKSNYPFQKYIIEVNNK